MIDWKKYLLVFLITVGLFFTASYLSNYFGDKKIDQIKNNGKKTKAITLWDKMRPATDADKTGKYINLFFESLITESAINGKKTKATFSPIEPRTYKSIMR